MEIALLTAGICVLVFGLLTAIGFRLVRQSFRLPAHVRGRTFPCQVRLVTGRVPGMRVGRPQRVTAVWCHTVLLLRRQGLSVTRWALGVEFLGSPEPVAGVAGFGTDVVRLTARLDQHVSEPEPARVQLTARRRDLELLVGPFVAAGVQAGGSPGR
ncbi:MAG TPA: hypothetical protein VFX41_05080 [Actinomycetales bacterium]|nr:hypothetical protein [Actinomycetales bacterium]